MRSGRRGGFRAAFGHAVTPLSYRIFHPFVQFASIIRHSVAIIGFRSSSSSFRVQSAMAAQEASNQNPQNAAASSASPMAKAPLGATIPQKQVIPSPSKSLKVDISKQAAASSESPKETQPLSKPTASATLERPFSSASTNSAPLTAAIASPVDASDCTTPKLEIGRGDTEDSALAGGKEAPHSMQKRLPGSHSA